MATAITSRFGRIAVNSTSFFLCDMQEKFMKSIRYFDDIVLVQQRLLAAANILDIPLIVTEQYPKGLGNTVPSLDTSKAKGIISKTDFSMMVPETEALMKEMPHIKSVVLFGIETHVCIHHTALDLIDKNYEVHIVVDAVSSRSMVDRMYGIERLRQSGAFITTSESVLLALMGGSKHPQFRAIQKLIATSAPETGLLCKV